MKDNYCVYMHENKTNNKKYFGITGNNPLHRWGNGLGYKGQTVFYRAILKYGWNNFKHEILFTGLSQKEAEAKEIELIAKYKTNYKRYGYQFGYNACDGGGITRKGSKYENKIIKGFKVISYDSLKGKVKLQCLNCGNVIERVYSILTADSNIKCKCNYKPKKRLAYNRICEYCNKGYLAKFKQQKYCSQECSHKASAIKLTGKHRVQKKNCLICGEEFYPKYKSKVYCSNKCQWQSMRKNF